MAPKWKLFVTVSEPDFWCTSAYHIDAYMYKIWDLYDQPCGPGCTDDYHPNYDTANNDAGNNNNGWLTNHDSIGSLAFEPNEPKIIGDGNILIFLELGSHKTLNHL